LLAGVPMRKEWLGREDARAHLEKWGKDIADTALAVTQK